MIINKNKYINFLYYEFTIFSINIVILYNNININSLYYDFIIKNFYFSILFKINNNKIK